MKKKILALLLAALMIVGMLPVTVLAAGNGSITVKNLSDQDMKLTLGSLVATSDNDLSYEPEGAPWPYACGKNEKQEFTVAPGKTITFSYRYGSQDPFNTEESWFTCDEAYAVSGDLDDFLPKNCHVKSAFDSNLVDASGLIFPKKLTGRDIADIFNGCSNLVKGPSLPATNLTNYCYSQMFMDCSKLSSLTVGFNSFNGGIYTTYGWLSGVASTGTIYVNDALLAEINGQGFVRNASTVPSGWTVVGPKSNPSAPSQGVGYTLDYEAETMVASTDYEVSSTNGDTATALTDNKVTPGNTYYVRLKETDTANASPWTANTIAARPAKADTPTLSGKTETSITVTAVTGQEYSIDNGTSWVSDGGDGDGDAATGTVTFSELTKDETYSIITRTKAVTSGSVQFAGVNSDALSVTAEFEAEPITITGTLGVNDLISSNGVVIYYSYDVEGYYLFRVTSANASSVTGTYTWGATSNGINDTNSYYSLGTTDRNYFAGGEFTVTGTPGNYTLTGFMVEKDGTRYEITLTSPKTLPYSFDFETYPFSEANGWKSINADGDGYGWDTDTTVYWDHNYGINGTNCAFSMSFGASAGGARQANNWMFSPAITIPEDGATVSWYEQSQSYIYFDSYNVYVSEMNTSTDSSGMTKLYSGTAAHPWKQRTVNLSAEDYGGKTVYIAFQHNDYNMMALAIDNFAVETLTYTYEVRFPKGPEQVYISGNENSWSFTPMTMTSDTTATITLDTPFTEYKYTAGADWAYVEKGADGSELSNRTAYGNPDVVAKWAKVPAPAPDASWTDWETFGSGKGTYSYVALQKGTNDVEVYVRTSQNDSKIKQLKLAGWGKGIITTDGVDLIVDWNETTGNITIPKQSTGDYKTDYQEYENIQDFNSYIGLSDDDYYYDPCTYDSSTGTFNFNVIYFISCGYFGSGLDTLTMTAELTAPQVPTVAEASVKAIMCDTYDNNLGWRPQDWGDCSWVGKNIKGVNFQYAQTMDWDCFASDFAGVDVADYAKLHFDIWFAEGGNAPIVKLEFADSDPTEEITIPGTYKAGWNSVNINVADIFGVQPMDKLKVLTVKVTEVGGPVAWANILFYNGEYTSVEATVADVTIVNVEVEDNAIKTGDTTVTVKDADGNDIESGKLNDVANAINNVLNNEKVKKFDETDLDEATENNNNKIVVALKNQANDDQTAKDNVNETDISKYLNVKLVSADVDVATTVKVTSMVFDVTPMATITVTGSDGQVTLTTEITNDEVDGTVTFLLPVDKSITVATTAAVYHEGEFLDNFDINTDGSGNKYIEVTTNSFSEFGYITLDETTAGAKIGDKLYASLSDAVSKVANAQTITLLKDASGTITVSREVKFTVDANGKTNTATITAGSGYTLSESGNTYTVTRNPGPGPDPDPLPAEEEEQADPEVDIDFGFGNGPITIKTSNKSIVLDDRRIVEKIIGETEEDFISFDLAHAYIANTKSTKDFDGLFLNNEAYRYLGEAGKDIEIVNRFAYAKVYTGKEVGNNPLSLHLADVSKESGLCATAIQKRAMETSNIYAEVNYSFVTNGKPTDNSAKIYVPVPAEAKVFYLFDEGKIGTVPCENKDGYCVFDRYYDGTYVVVAK